VNAQRVRVLVIDDSALMRRVLSDILSRDAMLEVVGTAADAYVARDKIKRLNPDVLTLDVEMPLMDGISFLRNVMRLRPMPVVMCSSLTERGATITLQALALGAVDYVAKPRIDAAHSMAEYAEELITKVKAAAIARVRAPSVATPAAEAGAGAGAAVQRAFGEGVTGIEERIIAIGASTGGTEAIREVLVRMPPDSPGIVVTQHIPAAFSAAFAQRVNDSCALTVTEAADGEPILPGHAYVAPGDRHLLVVRESGQYRCRLDNGPTVNHHRPSVDVMFRSVTRCAGARAIGVLLTGMGKDGAAAMLEMRQAGAVTLAQDEASSVIWGMPGAAWRSGAAQALYPLVDIPRRLIEIVEAGGAGGIAAKEAIA